MAGRSVIIVGAGVAGLSAGCYLQMNGYETHIYEHHKKPGGVVAAWKRNDYLIDGAIHFLWGNEPGQSNYKLFSELGVFASNRFVDLTYFSFTDEATGRQIKLDRDLMRLAADLKSMSPQDARIIDDIIKSARSLQGIDLGDMGMGQPAELIHPMDQVKTMWGMRRALKYFTGRYARPVSEFVKDINDPFIRQFFENVFLPDVPAWFMLMLLAIAGDGQMALLETGSLAFVKAIEKRYMDLGGHITFRAPVEKILVENDRAIGVRLADGNIHYADVVVSAADGYGTIYKMLDGRYIDEKIEERFTQWKLFKPFIMASFGVNREFDGEPCISFIALKQPFTIGNESIDKIFIRLFNYSPHFAPQGKTVVQVEFETDWDYWNDLRNNDSDKYNTEKQRVAKEVLARLEARYPGISPQVEVTDVATPYTTWRYTRNHRGSFEGWLPTHETLLARVEKSLPGLGNFYMAGQWVMPGGGVPPSLYSGRHVAQLLCHRDGKTFTTTVP